MRNTYIFLLLLLILAGPVMAVEPRDSYLKSYNKVSNKLEKLHSDLNELAANLEFQTSSFREVYRTTLKIQKVQHKVYKRLKKLSQLAVYTPYANLVSQRSSSMFLDYKTRARQARRKSSRLKGSIDRLALFEEVNTLLQANQETLEELTVLSKSAAFGDPDSAGVFGVVSRVSGNCLPGPELDPSCIFETLATTVRVRSLATVSEAENFVYYNFAQAALAEIETNALGEYTLELDPGDYSIFVLDDGKEYCNSFDGDGYACKVTVKDSAKSEFNSTIDHSFQ